MKTLHRADLLSWSQFDEPRNIDFNSTLYQHSDGNVLIDPLPMTPHDEEHLEELGGASWIVVTNSDHIRVTAELAQKLGAKVAGPSGEKDTFPIATDRWLSDGEEIIPGLRAIEFDGSKTPGELALLLDDTTLITGDLLRSHQGGRLHLLPPEKLKDLQQARKSVARLLEHPRIEAIIVGDGWHFFNQGATVLRSLVDSW